MYKILDLAEGKYLRICVLPETYDLNITNTSFWESLLWQDMIFLSKKRSN